MISRYATPAAVALVLAMAIAQAQELPRPRFEVSRASAADGTAARAADLRNIEASYLRTRAIAQKNVASMVVRAREMKEEGHHAGLPSCRGPGERTIPLAETVPPRFRALTLYFVRIPKGGARPRILPETLPESAEVFVLETASLTDVATLSRILARRVSLASKDFARALGVGCADARVIFSTDGKYSTVTEVAP
jgi:hypothetical protein